MNTIGSRAQVMHGNALKTGGGLKKTHLKYNKNGKIVSKKASNSAKKSNNLKKAGFYTKKGVFGVFQNGGANKGNEEHEENEGDNWEVLANENNEENEGDNWEALENENNEENEENNKKIIENIIGIEEISYFEITCPNGVKKKYYY